MLRRKRAPAAQQNQEPSRSLAIDEFESVLMSLDDAGDDSDGYQASHEGASSEGQPLGDAAKTKGKLAMSSHQASTPPPAAAAQGTPQGTKKCVGPCKKVKDSCNFDKKESRCKSCRSSETAAQRRYGQALIELKTENIAKYEKFMRGFNKAAPADTSKHNRRGALIHLTLQSEAQASTGQLHSGKSKMMWEREYIEEAAKTYMGNMTQEEAQSQWELCSLVINLRSDSRFPAPDCEVGGLTGRRAGR